MRFVQYHKKKPTLPPPINTIKIGYFSMYYSYLASSYFGLDIQINNTNGSYSGVNYTNTCTVPSWCDTGLLSDTSNIITISSLLPTIYYSYIATGVLLGSPPDCTTLCWDGFDWVLCTVPNDCYGYEHYSVQNITIYTYDNTLSAVASYNISVSSLPQTITTGINEVYYLIEFDNVFGTSLICVC